MCAVLVEMETPMCGKLRRQPPFPFLPVDHVKVPGQHMDMQVASSHQECMEKFTETIRIPVRFTIDQHADPAVEIPAEDDDAVVSLDRGSAKLSGRGTDRNVPAGQTATLSGPLDGDEPIKTALAPTHASAFAQSVLQDEKALVQDAAAPASHTAPAAQRSAVLPANAPPVAMPAQVQGMTGAQDLAAYGAWSSAPNYGAVWYPPVEIGWVPYRHGHWAYIQPWGWTWVADEPWGFAPFHYGRWVMVHDRWAWSPGRPHHRHHHPRPVYAPALVAFFGGGGGISVTITTGNVGWVPLGWHEPYYPPYRVSRHYIRNVNVTHVTNITKVTNVTNVNNVTVNRYVNRGGATMVSADAMRRSEPVQRAVQRVDHRQIDNARVDRRAPIEPTAVQRRDAPGPDIRQSDRRSTDLRPVQARQAEPQLRNRQQVQPRQDRGEQQQRAVREQQRQGTEHQQHTQRDAQERQRQEVQRQEQRRQDEQRQQREVQARQGQERQRQQQEMQRQGQERQRQDVQHREQQQQVVQRQQEIQRQQADQQQREAQRRQQEVQQQGRQQEMRRQQQDADDQRRQRREQN